MKRHSARRGASKPHTRAGRAGMFASGPIDLGGASGAGAVGNPTFISQLAAPTPRKRSAHRKSTRRKGG